MLHIELVFLVTDVKFCVQICKIWNGMMVFGYDHVGCQPGLLVTQHKYVNLVV